MRNLTCFLALVIFSHILLAQTNLIPNPSFEIWNGGEPVNWETNNDTAQVNLIT